MKSLLYVGASYILFFLYIWDYAAAYQEFFPTVVALTQSPMFFILCTNAVIATAVLVWISLCRIFFIRLYPVEVSVLKQEFPALFLECLIVPLYFSRALVGVFTLVNIFILLSLLFHKLANERINTISTLVDENLKQKLSFALARFLSIAVLVDLASIFVMWNWVSSSDQDTVVRHYYALLYFTRMLISSVRSAVRLVHNELFGEERRSHVAFFAESFVRITEACVSIAFFIYVTAKSSIPFPLGRVLFTSLRTLYESATQICSYLMLRGLPDATAEDLKRDVRCTICYEAMQLGHEAKRLPCGHCYHDQCLQRWLEEHRTCPYCRTDLLKQRLSATFTRRRVPPQANGAQGAAAEEPVVDGSANAAREAPPDLSEADIEREFALYQARVELDAQAVFQAVIQAETEAEAEAKAQVESQANTQVGASSAAATAATAAPKEGNSSEATDALGSALRAAAFHTFHKNVKKAQEQLERDLRSVEETLKRARK